MDASKLNGAAETRRWIREHVSRRCDYAYVDARNYRAVADVIAGRHGGKSYFNDRGSESFLGDRFSNSERRVFAAGGGSTAPLRTISVAVTFLP